LLVVEPADHSRYRKTVSKVPTARAVGQPRTQAIADQLLDSMEGQSELDLEPNAPRLETVVAARV
jgi:cytochrome P450